MCPAPCWRQCGHGRPSIFRVRGDIALVLYVSSNHFNECFKSAISVFKETSWSAAAARCHATVSISDRAHHDCRQRSDCSKSINSRSVNTRGWLIRAHQSTYLSLRDVAVLFVWTRRFAPLQLVAATSLFVVLRSRLWLALLALGVAHTLRACSGAIRSSSIRFVLMHR